jgi:hypothetical protein
VAGFFEVLSLSLAAAMLTTMDPFTTCKPQVKAPNGTQVLHQIMMTNRTFLLTATQDPALLSMISCAKALVPKECAEQVPETCAAHLPSQSG